MLLNDYQEEALHNVRRTAESARAIVCMEDHITDAFQHILDELRVAGIHSPEGPTKQLAFAFYEEDDQHEICPTCGKRALVAIMGFDNVPHASAECTNCGWIV